MEAGQAYDALAGVTASDPEDGDLTAMITVESTPTLDFKGGKATPETAGSYELVYSVTDKAGATADSTSPPWKPPTPTAGKLWSTEPRPPAP